MPILLLIFGLLMPRIVLIFIALLTHWFSVAFSTVIWSILGWFFMPYTTLAYLLAMVYNQHQITGGWLILLIAAVIVDLGAHGGAYAAR